MSLHAFDTICKYAKGSPQKDSMIKGKKRKTEQHGRVKIMCTPFKRIRSIVPTHTHIPLDWIRHALRQSLLFFSASDMLLLFRWPSEAGYALFEMARSFCSPWIPSYSQDVQSVFCRARKGTRWIQEHRGACHAGRIIVRIFKLISNYSYLPAHS